MIPVQRSLLMDYERYISVVNGFPKAGISFKDISPLLRDPDAFHHCIDDFAELAEPYHPTVILGPESRGFIFGAALAYKMGIGFVMARKAGKLPGMCNDAKVWLSIEKRGPQKNRGFFSLAVVYSMVLRLMQLAEV